MAELVVVRDTLVFWGLIGVGGYATARAIRWLWRAFVWCVDEVLRGGPVGD